DRGLGHHGEGHGHRVLGPARSRNPPCTGVADVPWFAGVTNRGAGSGTVGMQYPQSLEILRRAILRMAIAALLLAVFASDAPAQTNRVAEVAEYQGADREHRL